MAQGKKKGVADTMNTRLRAVLADLDKYKELIFTGDFRGKPADANGRLTVTNPKDKITKVGRDYIEIRFSVNAPPFLLRLDAVNLLFTKPIGSAKTAETPVKEPNIGDPVWNEELRKFIPYGIDPEAGPETKTETANKPAVTQEWDNEKNAFVRKVDGKEVPTIVPSED